MTPTALGEKFCKRVLSARLNIGTFAFNIFICDMFYFLSNYEIANYAGYTTLYSALRNHQFVIEELEKSSAILFKWLGKNFMKVNTD